MVDIINNYRKSPELVKKINLIIHDLVGNSIIKNSTRPFTIMEVCGTHTMSIYRYGLKDILPKEIKLISGPGCPVCVTPASLIEKAIVLAKIPNVILCTFGDMMRVPAYSGNLNDTKNGGADVKIIYSPIDALKIAQDNPKKEVVFFAVGFETTAPLTAAVIDKAERLNLRNFSIISAHKTMPQALRKLLKDTERIDALLCPGHVATITGADAFSFVPIELNKPAVIAGFEAVDLMEAIYLLINDAVNKEVSLRNAYKRSVKAEGNKVALSAIERVFVANDAIWRGIGEIEASGLKLSPNYSQFDALDRFSIDVEEKGADRGCRCGEVLQGIIEPSDCPLMANVCTPHNPRGACMVSSEGSCAAYYKYGRR